MGVLQDSEAVRAPARRAQTPVIGASRRAALRRRQARRWLISATFLVPALVLMAIYRVVPVVSAIHLSFTEWDGFSEPVFVGLANYAELMHDDRFFQSLLVNLRILIAAPFMVLVPFVLAALLQSRVPGWAVFRAVYFFPTLLSPVVIGLAFKMMLADNGAVNLLLRFVGLDALERPWLKDSSTALLCVVVIAGWSVVGTGVVLFLAAMGTVDPSLIEAARIDGASWWRVQRHVVFWQILPVIELWAVLLLISMLTSFFPMILIMTQGGPSYSTSTADLYAYQQAFEGFAPGYASAAIVVITLLTIVIVAVAMGLFRRGRDV